MKIQTYLTNFIFMLFIVLLSILFCYCKQYFNEYPCIYIYIYILKNMYELSAVFLGKEHFLFNFERFCYSIFQKHYDSYAPTRYYHTSCFHQPARYKRSQGILSQNSLHINKEEINLLVYSEIVVFSYYYFLIQLEQENQV